MAAIDLFISHSSADTQVAESIVSELEKRGIFCWFAPRDVTLGGEYQAEIVQALDTARAVLLIFSKNANASQHILREIELAVQDRKPVYPVRIDGTMPSHGLRYLLANKQWVDHKDPISGLVDRIERLMRRPTPADGERISPAPSPPAGDAAAPPVSSTLQARRSHYGLFGAIGTAVTCLALAGGWLAIYGPGWFHPAPAPQTAGTTHAVPVPAQPPAPPPAAIDKDAAITPQPAPAEPPRPAPSPAPPTNQKKVTTAPQPTVIELPRPSLQGRPFAAPTGTDTRRAFIVGMQRYADANLQQLIHTVVDAQDLAGDLQSVGFESANITQLRDAKNRASFAQAFEKFLATVEPGNTVVFSFSGHGYGLDAKNDHFLLVGDVKSAPAFTAEQLPAAERKNPDIVRLRVRSFVQAYEEREIPRVGISLNEIVKKIAERQPKNVLMLIDACRSLLPPEQVDDMRQFPIPCARPQTREPPPGFVLLHSGSRGDEPVESFDFADARRNSLFMETVRAELQRPGQTLDEFVQRVAAKVNAIAERNGRQQKPEYVIGPAADEFRLVESIGAERFLQPPDRCRWERAAWANLMQTGQRDLYLKHLRRFANCTSAELARGALNQLSLDGEDPPIPAPSKSARPVSDCDRLAAAPSDMARPSDVPGIRFERMDTETAIAACIKAVAENPRVPRYVFNLGRAYLSGNTPDRDLAERERILRSARLSLEDAIRRGYSIAFNYLAVLMEDAGKIDEAIKLFMSGAEQGVPAAMFNLAHHYREGGGVTRDFRMAHDLMTKAAEAGFTSAMVELGDDLRTGRGLVSNNPRRAVEWYLRAAESGSRRAQMRLGASYLSGIGWRGFGQADRKSSVAPDLERSLLWYSRAAMFGDPEANAQIATIIEVGAESLGLPLSLAEHYWALAAAGGNTRALIASAKKLMETSVSASFDQVGIVESLERAAALNSATALRLLAQMHRKGLLKDSRGRQAALPWAYRAIDLAAEADPTEPDYDPTDEVAAAHVLIEMARNGEAVGPQGSPLLTPDEVDRLEYYYGAYDSASHQVGVAKLRSTLCGQSRDLFVWNWGREEIPTAAQMRAVNNVRDDACRQIKVLDTKFSEAFAYARNSKGKFLLQLGFLSEPSQPSTREKYTARMQSLLNDLQGEIQRAGGDVTSSVIETAIDKAYRQAGLSIYESFVGDGWSPDRMRLMMIDEVTNDLSMVLMGIARGSVDPAQIGMVVERAAARIHRRVFEILEFVGASRSASTLRGYLREAGIGGMDGDSAINIAIKAAAGEIDSLQAVFIREDNPSALEHRVQRIVFDCISENLAVGGSSARLFTHLDELEQRVGSVMRSTCSQWIKNQFLNDTGTLKPQKPVPSRAIWSAEGPKDVSATGRPL
jgi:TPR repeat protein